MSWRADRCRLKRLLDLGVQIADGLSAAHANGIVHRDIKPENVMLARDGTARIVDFGLARSDPRAPGMSAVIGQAATVTASIEGLSGTPAYMSPEQARGTAGDFRTDQFSFGVLLYEMATGKYAFRRDTMADTLAAVLHDEPQPIAEQNPRIPTPVRWIIERCLTKDAVDRYSATDDLARELRWIRDRLAEARLDPKPEPAPSRGVRGWRLLGATAVAAIAGRAGRRRRCSHWNPTHLRLVLSRSRRRRRTKANPRGRPTVNRSPTRRTSTACCRSS